MKVDGSVAATVEQVHADLVEDGAATPKKKKEMSCLGSAAADKCAVDKDDKFGGGLVQNDIDKDDVVAAPPPLPEGEFLEGEAVVLHGLTKSPELNGQSGLVLGFDSQARRYMVKLVTDVLGTLSDKTLRIKAGNLASADEVDFSADEADDMFSEEAVRSDAYKVSQSMCRLHRTSSGALAAQRAAALHMNYPDQ